MSLKDQMIKDARKIFLNTDEFAEEVVYTTSSGTIIPNCKVIIEKGEDLGANNIKGLMEKGLSANAIISIAVADVPNPEYQDTITANGRTWTVESILESDGAMHKLACSDDRRGRWR